MFVDLEAAAQASVLRPSNAIGISHWPLTRSSAVASQGIRQASITLRLGQFPRESLDLRGMAISGGVAVIKTSRTGYDANRSRVTMTALFLGAQAADRLWRAAGAVPVRVFGPASALDQ